MRATNAERVCELKTAVALREREVEELQEQIKELHGQIGVSALELQDDSLLASYPVLQYCGRRPTKSLSSIPIEQTGSVLSQFAIANKVIVQQNKKDTIELNALRRRLCEEEKRCREYTFKYQELSSDSGIDVKGSCAAGSPNGLSSRASPVENSLEELEAGQKIIQREIHAGNLLLQKKRRAMESLEAVQEQCFSTIDEIDQLYNQIRVANRDIDAEMEAIERLGAEVANVNWCLQEKQEALDSITRLLIDQEASDFWNEKIQTVNSQRIQQERVVKAQDYRLTQLDRRLKTIDKALRNNHFLRGVENILEKSWTVNTIVVPEDREKLYDVEEIIPAQERIHPGLYSLLLTEKERMARVVSRLNICTKEKEEVNASLLCNLEALCVEFNLTIQELDEVASSAIFAEGKERKKLLLFLEEQRACIERLINEKARLSKSISRK